MTGHGSSRARIARITPPRLQTLDQSRGRTATWLELFYDLAFVVVVAVLGQRLHEDVSWSGLASFIGYFALLWWLWASHTFYADRYDTDDLVYRVLATAQMMAVLVIAASLTSGPAESTTAFAAGYATARLVLLAMYTRVYRHVAETRRLVGGYLIGFGIAAGGVGRIHLRAGAGPVRPLGGGTHNRPGHTMVHAPPAGGSASRRVPPSRAFRPVHHPCPR